MSNAYTDRKLSARYPTDLAAWKKLAKHYQSDMRDRKLHDLFSRSSNDHGFRKEHVSDSKNVSELATAVNDAAFEES